MPRRDRRKEILRAAERLFAGGRFHEITVDEIAVEAGVGKGTIYRYFEDKDDVFFQALTAGSDELCERLVQNVPPDAPFETQLLAACTEIHAFFKSRRRFVRLMQVPDGRVPWRSGAFRERFEAHRQRLDAALGAIIERGVAEGRVRRDLPSRVLARMMLGMQGAYVRGLGEAKTGPAPLEVVVDLFLRGARAGA